MHLYTVVLKREAVGGYSVSVPALPGCHTQGDSLAEALLMAEDAIRLFLEALAARGQPAPPDSPQVLVGLEHATEALVYRLPVREGAAVG
ncbi:MAG: type II toxin-antitoxin system HicB family antitoxin [Armatimonadetes bacterium]|nr:type II toxin-antitoxin system HicB family antitoxin [Armatimonadota bacterium]